MGTRTIVRQVEIPADAGLIYEYLTTGEKLEGWFPGRAKTDPKVGGEYHFTFLAEGSVDHERTGKFTRLDPGEIVEYTWDFGAGETTVRFDITRNGNGSKVGLKHSGFGQGSEIDEAYTMHDQGWNLFLRNLASVIDGAKDLRKELGFA